MEYCTVLRTLRCYILANVDRMALALTHGSVGVFDRVEEDWKTYVERAANKITEAAERRDVFLSVCGPKTGFSETWSHRRNHVTRTLLLI